METAKSDNFSSFSDLLPNISAKMLTTICKNIQNFALANEQ